MNDTQIVTGTCIVSAGVLLMLLDGGASVIFSAIAGTSAYLVHNMAVDDIPDPIRTRYRDEMADLDASDKTWLAAASVLAGVGVVVNPWVGIPALVGTLILHHHMQVGREERFFAEAQQMGLA